MARQAHNVFGRPLDTTALPKADDPVNASLAASSRTYATCFSTEFAHPTDATAVNASRVDILTLLRQQGVERHSNGAECRVTNA